MKALPVLSVLLVLLAGCALERADPAARSNRTTYGAISLVASGDHSTVTLTIGDGTIASADGEGAITQPATLTTEQSPDVTVPGDAVSAGIQAIGHVAGKAIDAYATKASKAEAPSGGEPLQGEADCANGDCDVGACPGGDCDVGACVDGSCNL